MTYTNPTVGRIVLGLVLLAAAVVSFGSVTAQNASSATVQGDKARIIFQAAAGERNLVNVVNIRINGVSTYVVTDANQNLTAGSSGQCGKRQAELEGALNDQRASIGRTRGAVFCFVPDEIIADLGDYTDTFAIEQEMRSRVDVSSGSGTDLIAGGAGPDLLHGGDGADLLRGYGGDDVLMGDQGADTIQCGSGSDAFSNDGLDQIDLSCESAIAPK